MTHRHWDHVLGCPALVWGGWWMGRPQLRVIGPPGAAPMHDRLVESFYRDRAEWAIGLGLDLAGWEEIAITGSNACSAFMLRCVTVWRWLAERASGVSRSPICCPGPDPTGLDRSGYDGEVTVGADLDVTEV